MNLNQTFAILFRLNYSKANSKGLVPIWARITVDGERAECSTGKQIQVTHWDLEAGQANKLCQEAKSINDHLLLVKTEINRHYNILLSSQEIVTANDVKRSYKGKKEQKRTFLELFRQFNQHLSDRLKINDISPKRRQKFKMLYGKCQSFLKKKLKRDDIFLDEIKLNFLVEFELFLRTEDDVAINTSMKSAKDLKQVTKYAVTMEYLPSNPFANFKSIYKKGTRYFLTKSELQTMYKKKFDIKRLEEVRDCYIFSCYTGYAYADTESLRPTDISIGIDGEMWVIKDRKKTKVNENVPLLPRALQIINKYKKHPYCVKHNRLLPVNSNQRYNSYLKEIADVCGIKKKLTTHTARHTFATTVLLSNGVPMETAMELLGHTDIRTTQIYAKIVQEKISLDMKKLKKKLSQPTNMKETKKKLSSRAPVKRKRVRTNKQAA